MSCIAAIMPRCALYLRPTYLTANREGVEHLASHVAIPRLADLRRHMFCLVWLCNAKCVKLVHDSAQNSTDGKELTRC